MSRKAESNKKRQNEARLRPGLVLKPPVTAKDLNADTEMDPEGAEEFVALIRSLRKDTPRPLSL